MEGWRYMTEVVPLWTLLIALGLHEIVGTSRLRLIAYARNRLLPACYVGLALSFILAGWDYRDIEWKYRGIERRSVSWAAVGWTTRTQRMLEQTYIRAFLQTSDHLNALLPSGASVAFSQMGVIPYYTPQLHWLDTDGLTDAEVAHLPAVVHGRTGIRTPDVLVPTCPVGQLLLRRRPDYIIMTCGSINPPHPPVLNGAYLPWKSVVLDRPWHAGLLIWKHRAE